MTKTLYSTMRGRRALIGLLLALLTSLATQAQTTRYVSTTGTTPPSGATSWATSTTDLQGAINASASGDQVWVARGTYKPGGAASYDRYISFSMKEGVAIYGGFAGRETSLSDRPAVNPVAGPGGASQPNAARPFSTTLSGYFGQDDNNFNIIVNTNLTSRAILDGFVITGGIGVNGTGPSFIGAGGHLQR